MFNVLNDFKYVLQSIATSLQEIGVDEEGNQTDDILVESFVQLSQRFSERFENAFGVRSKNFLKNGCFVVHKSNCLACSMLVEGHKVMSLKRQKKFAIRGRFTCESVWCIFALTCSTCRQQFVGSSIASIGSKFQNFFVDGGQFSIKHKNHEVSFIAKH